MQISKTLTYFLAICVFASGVRVLRAQNDATGGETEARASAVDELNKKMSELEAQLQQADQPKPPAEEEVKKPAEKPAAEIVKPAPVVVEKPVVEKPVVKTPVAPKPVEAVVEMQPAPVSKPAAPVTAPTMVVTSTPAPKPVRASSDAIARAREEMRQTVSSLRKEDAMTQPQPAPVKVAAPAPKVQSKPVVVSKPAAPVAVSKPAPVVVSKPAPVQTPVVAKPAPVYSPQPAPSSDMIVLGGGTQPAPKVVVTTPQPAPTGSLPASTTKQEVVVKKNEKVVAKNTQARNEAEASAMKAAATKKPVGDLSAAALMQAPPPAVSAGKQAKLTELLARYRADKLTPEEYHAERAKVLAEP
jgi:hypothetical protein